jgi:glycerate 2-kinase
VLCLISGGGSSLLPFALPGLTLADKQALNRALLASGASIGEMSCVRRHFPAIEGGRLAAACHPARIVNLLLSDVPGDDPVNIASGLTDAGATTRADAMHIPRRYEIAVPPRALDPLESGEGESMKPDDRRLPAIQTRFVATPQLALEAAASVARDAGISPSILGDAIEGEARDVATTMAGIALHVARRGRPVAAPRVLLSGGETSVTAPGQGRGGRNVEFLLSLGIALDGEPGVHAMAGDTDGVDGQEEIAGAWLAPDTLTRAGAQGLKARERLDDDDGHGFFEALGDLVVTGPTLTNVNDFRAIMIDARSTGDR